MNDTSAAAFMKLVSGRPGHFRLESGYHSTMWLDLDPLFAAPREIGPFIDDLAAAIRPYEVAAVCGPLLGGAFLAQLMAHALEAEFSFTERVLPPDDDSMFGVSYRLPPAFAARLRGKRIAIVDDVMSAGSALRGTYHELKSHGAVPVVAGALLVLGSTGVDFFASRNVAVEAVARDDYHLWLPSDCPLCAASVPLEDVGRPSDDGFSHQAVTGCKAAHRGSSPTVREGALLTNQAPTTAPGAHGNVNPEFQVRLRRRRTG